MILPGLTSVTFRDLSVEEIVDLAAKAGLHGIEWGGDIHVPHGDRSAARKAANITSDAGLLVSSYGSYYYVCGVEAIDFTEVVDTAIELGAPGIRVWPGQKGSAEVDESYWSQFVEEARQIGDQALEAGLTVSFEFHRHSLTGTNESALKLLKTIDHPSIKTYWQPPVGETVEYSLEGLSAILPWLTNVHVYKLLPDCTRLPLEDGREDWKTYFKAMEASGRDHFALLEFVRDDSPEAFMEDAAVLKSLLGAG